MQKHSATKPGTPSFVPSKTIITGWLKSLFPDMPLSAKIQDFGDGVVYCRLLNHYYGNPPHSKITWAPKNQYQYANNLKHVQTALTQLSIVISFDVNRVSKRKFLENWALINSFYKHFNSIEEPVAAHQQNSVSSHGVQGHPLINHPVINHPSSFHNSQPTNSLTVQQPKSLKRPQPATGYPDLDQQISRPPGPSHFHQLTSHNPAQQSIWDHSLPMNFQNLAHSSLQMTQYLKQNLNLYNNSPTKGKWSVGSQMFQNNNHAVIDRVKEILLKGSHDTEKVRQIKMLLGMPIDEEEVIKIQDDDGLGPIVYSHKEEKVQPKQEKPLEKQQSKQLQQMLQKQYSSQKEQKMSVSKSGRKPFKI